MENYLLIAKVLIIQNLDKQPENKKNLWIFKKPYKNLTNKI